MVKYKDKQTEAIERWERIMGKKMTRDELTMFKWGYAYAINDFLITIG